MIQAIVFDFDGLILETERPQYEAWREVFQSFGRELGIEAWLEVMGRPVKIDRFPRRLSAELNRELDIDAVILQYREIVARRLDVQPVQPGVEAIIKEALGMGLRLAVASGSSHRWVDGHLQRLGLMAHFQHTVCAEDTQRHKPDPDPYLRACELLGVDPTSAMVFEDSALGVTAAKSAGMFAVAVPTDMTRDQDFGHADLVLPTLEGVSLGGLVEKAGNQES